MPVSIRLRRLGAIVVLLLSTVAIGRVSRYVLPLLTLRLLRRCS